MLKRLCFATHNPNKLAEIKKALEGHFEIVGLDDIGCTEEIAETGTTLRENAMIKARYVKENYGIDCFSDDTGLEIVALNNEPGVYSARYAGEPVDAQKNIDKVLKNLSDHENRVARFVTVIILLQNEEEHVFEGEVQGTITRKRIGGDGFGYDPIFQPNGFSETFAQMSMDEKNKISHRGRAVQKLLQHLKT